MVELLQFHTDIYAPHMMICNDFDCALTFHLVPSSGQSFNLSSALVYDLIPVKLMTLPQQSLSCAYSIYRIYLRQHNCA